MLYDKMAKPQVLYPVVALATIFAVWEAAVRIFAIPEFLLPRPTSIFYAVGQKPGLVAGHFLATLNTIVLGFVAAILASLPLAAALVASRKVESAAMPILVLIQSIPKVALAPILVVALGANELPRVIITFLICFFPILIATIAGLSATPRELLDLSAASRASGVDQFRLVRFPYSVPYIFSGLKVGATLAVIGAIVAEFVAADKGLGYLLVSATAFYDTPLAFGAMLLLCAIAIAFFQMVGLIQRGFFPWSIRSEP